jgi:hypothetical protein
MLLAFYDDWESLAYVAGVVFAAYLLIMWIAALVWTYRDIVSRTRDTFTQTVSLVLVLVFNLPGLLLYLILRPKDTLADQYDRQLEAEALLHELQEQATCPRCRRKIESDFVACPYCREQLRIACESCGKAMAPTWVMCAYCGTERRDVAPAPRAAATAQPAPAASSPAPSSSATTARVRRPSTATYTPPASPAPQPAADAPDPTS